VYGLAVDGTSPFVSVKTIDWAVKSFNDVTLDSTITGSLSKFSVSE